MDAFFLPATSNHPFLFALDVLGAKRKGGTTVPRGQGQPRPRWVGKKSDRRATWAERTLPDTIGIVGISNPLGEHAWHVLATRRSGGRRRRDVRHAFGSGRGRSPRPGWVICGFTNSFTSGDLWHAPSESSSKEQDIAALQCGGVTPAKAGMGSWSLKFVWNLVLGIGNFRRLPAVLSTILHAHRSFAAYSFSNA